ncbi:DUF1707 SHOCT-like domain-containing protein [Actinopolymorpha alba]|uniref:DUF1707 SHOCT-like domain-containing protein n=1 Tax=Actinopolymorpha alba TaxID=533267 RepID=UPI0012F68F19
MPYGPEMRASDNDREKIASRLRDAHAEGRLSIDEFQDRLDVLYKANTYGELEPLVRDIPVTRTPNKAPAAPQSAPAQAPATPQKRTGGDRAMAVLWTIWACAVSVNLVVWVMTSATNGKLEYFWPIWVAGPWGAILLSITVMRRQFRD